jgi:molybdopterin synthase catalytic subunit
MPGPRFALTGEALSVKALSDAVLRTPAGQLGAVATFVGIVRGQNRGHEVRFLDYEAYEPLALRSFERIDDEARGRWPGIVLGIHHRIGRLDVGEVSIVIVAGSAHRADAFAACRYAIERVKQITPIWKHEHFEGGETWVEGATVDPDDQSAVAEAVRRACV